MRWIRLRTALGFSPLRTSSLGLNPSESIFSVSCSSFVSGPGVTPGRAPHRPELRPPNQNALHVRPREVSVMRVSADVAESYIACRESQLVDALFSPDQFLAGSIATLYHKPAVAPNSTVLQSQVRSCLLPLLPNRPRTPCSSRPSPARRSSPS